MTNTEVLQNILASAEGLEMPKNTPFIIDPNTKIIAVPEEEKKIGVYHDYDSERKYFLCPRYVGDNVDLSQMVVSINFTNANGYTSFYVCDDVTANSEYVTFSWLVGYDAVAAAGTVKFIVCASKAVGGKLSVEWNTEIATGIVAPGIEVDIDDETVTAVEQSANKILAEMISAITARANAYLGVTREQALSLDAILKKVVYYEPLTAQEKQAFQSAWIATIPAETYIDPDEIIGGGGSSSGGSGSGSGGGSEDSGGTTPSRITLQRITATYSGGSVPAGTSTSELKGVSVRAEYSDGTNKAVSGWVISERTLNATGTETITVYYTEGNVTANASFNVTVTGSQTVTLERITAVYNGGDLEVGETISRENFRPYVKVTAFYSNSTSAAVTDFVYNLQEIKAGNNDIEIRYTEGGVTKTATVTVVGVYPTTEFSMMDNAYMASAVRYKYLNSDGNEETGSWGSAYDGYVVWTSQNPVDRDTRFKLSFTNTTNDFLYQTNCHTGGVSNRASEDGEEYVFDKDYVSINDSTCYTGGPTGTRYIAKGRTAYQEFTVPAGMYVAVSWAGSARLNYNQYCTVEVID